MDLYLILRLLLIRLANVSLKQALFFLKTQCFFRSLKLQQNFVWIFVNFTTCRLQKIINCWNFRFLFQIFNYRNFYKILSTYLFAKNWKKWTLQILYIKNQQQKNFHVTNFFCQKCTCWIACDLNSSEKWSLWSEAMTFSNLIRRPRRRSFKWII